MKEKTNNAIGQTAVGGSVMTLDREGNLGMILRNQTELSPEEKKKLMKLQEQSAMLGHAVANIGEQIKGMELKLMKNPDYQLMQRMVEKKRIAKKMQREVEVVLSHEYDELYQSRALSDKVTELYMNALPEAPARTGKRGRPKSK